jgi:(4-(4-[2-(gamma-L-glutamylamino)ethyl]phenoxymethyl)furan-2-yl)methanamine synthase
VSRPVRIKDDIIGWDIGGAHLKLAWIRDGQILDIRQLPCPLWQGLDRLAASMAEGLKGWPRPRLHKVTMTGELSDLFPDRKTGVRSLIDAVAGCIGDAELFFYGGCDSNLRPAEAAERWRQVASANWHASAMLAASLVGTGLLADIGSTTTDFVPFRNGRVDLAETGDFDRLAARELVYRGVVRTPIMAVMREIVLNGKSIPVMAEHFATMADVYRLTGELPDHADQHPAADGRGKSLAESRARLARMIGCDACDGDEEVWRGVAQDIARCQLRQLDEAAGFVASRSLLDADAAVIGAGIGRFVAVELARHLGRAYRGIETVIEASSPELGARAADSLPAAAVALLTAIHGVE